MLPAICTEKEKSLPPELHPLAFPVALGNCEAQNVQNLHCHQFRRILFEAEGLAEIDPYRMRRINKKKINIIYH